MNLKVREPWDLDNVVPDFFPMPASVVFAHYAGVGQGTPLAPGTIQVWRGDWQEDYAGITRKSEALHHDDGKFKSPTPNCREEEQTSLTASYSSSNQCPIRQ